MPDVSLLQKIKERGNWTPVPRSVLSKLVELALKIGERFDRDIAMADLILHSDRGANPTLRDYAARWRWSKSSVERFIQELREEPEGEEVRGTSVGQDWDKCGTESRDSKLESADHGTSVGQDWDKDGTEDLYIDRAPQTREKNKKNNHTHAGGSQPEDLSGWTQESLPVRAAYLQWRGTPPDAPMTQTIRLLLMPRGAPQGARVPGDLRLYNGYSPEEIIAAIEAMAMSAHHSPASLVRHAAGLIGQVSPTPASAAEQPRGQPLRRQPMQQGWMTEEEVRRRQEREPRIKQALEAWSSPEGTRYRLPTTTPAPKAWICLYKPSNQPTEPTRDNDYSD